MNSMADHTYLPGSCRQRCCDGQRCGWSRVRCNTICQRSELTILLQAMAGWLEVVKKAVKPRKRRSQLDREERSKAEDSYDNAYEGGGGEIVDSLSRWLEGPW